MISSESRVLVGEYHDLEVALDKIVKRIRDRGRRYRSVAGVLSRLKRKFNLGITDGEAKGEMMEDRLVFEVEADPLSDGAVMGVDGGVLNRSMHGLDLILVRAVAVAFRYRNGRLSSFDYHPSALPTPQLICVDQLLDSRELELMTGIQRQLIELRVAREALKEHEVDVLLLDGSVLPQYLDKAPRSPQLRDLYGKLIEAFLGLYEDCEGLGVILAGAVKDSRGSRCLNILRQKVLPPLAEKGVLSQEDLKVLSDNDEVFSSSCDTAFLNYLLSVGERSFAIKCTDSSGKVLGDLGKWARHAYTFYVKTVPFDFPIRVEFMDTSGEVSRIADRLASLVYALSGDHSSCAIPTVLIEADARARLAEEELAIIADDIISRLEPFAPMELRRRRGPFQ
ncbi:MAG: DNA double-strand break repair nuclease NurA [Hadesarchaea archaeon]|nr:DNA double-strand break repair nuclease NurA [Hadesarchaea archaeon]